jgi:hypothetical protein
MPAYARANGVSRSPTRHPAPAPPSADTARPTSTVRHGGR